MAGERPGSVGHKDINYLPSSNPPETALESPSIETIRGTRTEPFEARWSNSISSQFERRTRE